MRTTLLRNLSLAFTALLPFKSLPAQPAPAAASTDILTKGFDNQSSQWNSHETILTQASIGSKGLNRLASIPVYGDRLGMEAQPLVLTNVTTAMGVRDVMVLPSEADVVRGVDAHTGDAIWQATLGTPVKSTGAIDMHQINDHMGCMSTGVIVKSTGNWYGVCWVSTDNSGTPASGRYFMFVRRVADGSQVVAPVPIQGTDTRMWKQRSSLVSTSAGSKGTIFFAHGSVYETSSGYTGGIQAFDVATNKIVAMLPLSSGVWMAGQKLEADPEGHLYAITGNGDFDPAKGWFGESFIKVSFTPATANSPAKLFIAPGDYWSPWTDAQRSGNAPKVTDKLAGASAPSETLKPVGGNMRMSLANAQVSVTRNRKGEPMLLVFPSMATGAWSDEDWGSAGPACLFQIKLCIAAGKDGIGYPVRTDVPGGTTLATVGTAANYGKLAAPCAWLTVDPGPVPCDPPDSTKLNFFPWGDTAHLHMTPVQMWDPLLNSWTIFAWGENERLHKWAVSSTGALSYVAEGNEFASAGVRGRNPGGMPGGFCSGSSNGTDASTYLLVCVIPYGDANATITQARILVYDPVHTSNGTIPVLWDSQQWGWNVVDGKFNVPIIWGGKIYYPNFAGSVERLGQ